MATPAINLPLESLRTAPTEPSKESAEKDPLVLTLTWRKSGLHHLVSSCLLLFAPLDEFEAMASADILHCTIGGMVSSCVLFH
jgi:hypothetical protein